MIYSSCKIVIEEGGEFDRLFGPFCESHQFAAARLFQRLRLFGSEPRRHGDHLKSNAGKSIYVVPPQYELDYDGVPGILVEVENKIARPIRFLPPARAHDWSSYLEWIERRLGI